MKQHLEMFIVENAKKLRAIVVNVDSKEPMIDWISERRSAVCIILSVPDPIVSDDNSVLSDADSVPESAFSSSCESLAEGSL